jgi:hypothetical protein
MIQKQAAWFLICRASQNQRWGTEEYHEKIFFRLVSRLRCDLDSSPSKVYSVNTAPTFVTESSQQKVCTSSDCVCRRVSTHMCLCMNAYTHITTYVGKTRTQIGAYVCVCVCVRVRVQQYVHVCLCLYNHVRFYSSNCPYVWMCVFFNVQNTSTCWMTVSHMGLWWLQILKCKRKITRM